MAREAGFHVGDQFVAGASEAELKAFEALVRADEREACAKVCEDDALSSQYGERSKYRELLASAIRARGNT
jgi:hypothetical protein